MPRVLLRTRKLSALPKNEEMSEDNVASEPCKAEGASSEACEGNAEEEQVPEVAAHCDAAVEETSEDKVAPVSPFQAENAEASQEDAHEDQVLHETAAHSDVVLEESPVKDAEHDKEMSEDMVASEPFQADHTASKEDADEDSQRPEAHPEAQQAEELAAVEDVESCEVQVRVEEVDYEDPNVSDGELLEDDAESAATEAESEDEVASTSAAEDLEDAGAEAEDPETSDSSSKVERHRHKRRRRSSHHGHRRRRRHHSSRGHGTTKGTKRRRDTSRGRRGKRTKTEKDDSGVAKNKQPVVPRAQREVYVGGLFWTDADKEGIAEAFNSAFEALPDYQKRYSNETRKPVLQVHYPKEIIRKASAGLRGDFAIFVFVEFIDQLLARSALKLTGIRIAQRSVRVCSTMGIEVEGETLDVDPLRHREKIPMRPLEGTTMLLNVWLGGLPMRLCREELHRKRSGHRSWAKEAESLESQICTAVLALPGITARYPQMERPIVSLRVSECQRYLFVEAATELIASSMVAAKALSLPGGLEATTGWPVAVIDAEERAPPPLAEDGNLCDPSKVGALVQKAIVCEEDFAERLDCEIFMGGTNGLEVEDLWKTLTEMLMGLPSYQKEFPDLSLPLINIRMAAGPYAFARLANPRLASTAVVIGEMFVRSRKVQLKRPTHCEVSQKSAPALDVIRPSLLPPPPPRTPRRRPKGPEFPVLPKAPELPRCPCEAPPTPPKVPLTIRPRGKIQSIWIGNLPGREKMLEMIDPEEDEKQENKGDAVEMMKRCIDRRVNELAMEMPNYDLEDGPLTKRVTVHPTGRYAFIRVMGDQEFVEELLDVLDGKDFMGKPLRVNWAREKEEAWWQKKRQHFHRSGVPRYPLQLPKGLQQLIAPPPAEQEMEDTRTEEVEKAEEVTAEIDEL